MQRNANDSSVPQFSWRPGESRGAGKLATVPRPAENCPWEWFLHLESSVDLDSLSENLLAGSLLREILQWVGQQGNRLQRGIAAWPSTDRLQVAPGRWRWHLSSSSVSQRIHLKGNDLRSQHDRSDASQEWEWRGKETQPGDPHPGRKKNLRRIFLSYLRKTLSLNPPIAN